MAATGNAGSQDRDVVDLLHAQHDEVRSLFTELASAAGDDRKGPFDRLVNLLAVHETAEEMVVYPAVRSSGPDGEGLADARTAEESEAKNALSHLEKLGVADPDFAPRLQQLQQMVETHAQNEEREIFPLLRQTQSPEQLAKMAESLEAAERVAPTHPHPHGPDSAAGNMAVGPFVGIVDRIRDALRGRSGG
jgi:hemerythrin superfamily protein